MRDGHCVAIEHVEVFVKYVGTTSVNEPIITALAAAIRDKLRNDGVDFAKENVKVLPEAVQLSIKEPLRWRVRYCLFFVVVDSRQSILTWRRRLYR